MKILWFCNTPPSVISENIEKSNMVIGGWMDSLRLVFEDLPDIDLAIASSSEVDYSPIKKGNVTYFNIPIPPKSGSLRSIYGRWLHGNDNIPSKISRCTEIINTFQPDCIHIHGTENYFGLLCRNSNYPIVISLQGILSVIEREFYGRMQFWDQIRENISFNFLRGVSTFHSHEYIYQSSIREREIVRNCSNFIGRTEFDKGVIKLINKNASYYHCDEVLRPTFYNGSWDESALENVTIYTTLSSSPYKGLDCLLDACSILRTCGYSNIKMRIGGIDKESLLWSFFSRIVDDFQLSNMITWLGKVTADQVKNELINASVFVLPSYAENSPNSLCEAMMIGTPCVASYTGGIPSIVEHGKNGLLYPNRDAYSLAAKISQILSTPTLAKELSHNAQISAKRRHNPAKIAMKMMDIYKNIISNQNFQSD